MMRAVAVAHRSPVSTPRVVARRPAAIAPRTRGAVGRDEASRRRDALSAPLARAVQQRARTATAPDGPLLQRSKKKWGKRRDQIVATLEARDRKDAKLISELLATRPDGGRELSKNASLHGVANKPKSRAARADQRAQTLLDEVKRRYFSPENLPDVDVGQLGSYLNSAQGFGVFREALITELVAANSGMPLSKLMDYHDLGINFSGAGACYNAGLLMTAMLKAAGYEAESRHKYGTTDVPLVGRRDHVWTLLGDGRIVDATWKQFWKPRDPETGDPAVTDDQWAVLNAEPDVFVGTRRQLRRRIRVLNERLGGVFDNEHIADVLSLYGADAQKPATLFLEYNPWAKKPTRALAN
jgi:hypothetical protein